MEHSSSENDQGAYVVKPVTPSIFNFLQEVKDTFGDNPRLRTHVDQNDEQRGLIYDYCQFDLLELVSNYPAMPLKARKKILYEVGLALNAMHEKNWLHLDVKPNNVMVNCFADKTDTVWIQKVELGDMDCALKLESEEETFDALIGNVIWRSPEGQLGRGVAKHSEVFSFGLVCLFVITGAQWLPIKREELTCEPEPLALYKHLTAFGPLPEGLLTLVNDADGESLLRGLWEEIEAENLFDPFEHWQEQIFPNLNHETKRLISRMTNLDPAKRLTMSQVLKDSYWEEVIDADVFTADDGRKA